MAFRYNPFTGTLDDVGLILAPTTSFEVTQGAPVLTLGQTVRSDGVNLVPALADSENNRNIVGRVTNVNGSIYTIATEGYVDITGLGLLANTKYFLSDTVAGAIDVYANIVDKTYLTLALITIDADKGVITRNLKLENTSGGGNSVIATVNFGSSFTDKAQTVVTGQVWVGASSKIVAQILTPSLTDTDEMYLLDIKIVISNLVAGVGFTVTAYSEREVTGSFQIMCIGV